MPAPRCSAFIAASLDGFIARPDHSLDWLDAVQQPGEDYGYADFMATVDALVIGRKTYDKVLTFGAWPYAGKRCVVLTRSPGTPRYDEELVAESPRAVVARLGDAGVKRIYVDGGALIRSFLADGLLDDLTISTIPVVLGSGIPLFGTGLPERRFTLEEARGFPSGLVRSRYRAA